VRGLGEEYEGVGRRHLTCAQVGPCADIWGVTCVRGEPIIPADLRTCITGQPWLTHLRVLQDVEVVLWVAEDELLETVARLQEVALPQVGAGVMSPLLELLQSWVSVLAAVDCNFGNHNNMMK